MGVLDEKYEQYLENAYHEYYNSPDHIFLLNFKNTPSSDKDLLKEMIDHLKFLENEGYITILELSSTRVKYRITRKGLEYFDPQPKANSITINQGNNSTNTAFVGNNNSLDINLERVLQEIDHSDIDRESKNCLRSFVSELESVPQESRLQKVKDFVGKISSGAIQASIPSLMTFFLSRYLHL